MKSRRRAWLAALGVSRFETQEPSDLEYDPQLRIVAEWRDPNTLYRDHVDNVAIEAMLHTEVPEGMSATIALRVLTFSWRHRDIRERVLADAEDFERRYGYRPPEWELLAFAQSAAEVR